MIGRIAALAVLLVAPFAIAPALADRPFILPSSTLLAGDAIVTFDAAGADHVFFFDHRPLALETIKAFRPDGTVATPANATRTRLRSVFDLRLDQQGTWTVASEQTMVTGSFTLNGEERRVGGRPAGPGGPPAGARGDVRGMGERAGQPGDDRGPERARDRGAETDGGQRMAMPGSGGLPGDAPRRQPPVVVADIPAEATDVHLTETIARAATFVTAGAPTPIAKPTGHGLEFDPITHPNSIVAGETARFRFLVDGRPAPGVKVTIVKGGERYRDTVGTTARTTGTDGSIAFTWPTAGMYWLGAEAEDAHPAEKRAERRRMTYAATLEVMTP